MNLNVAEPHSDALSARSGPVECLAYCTCLLQSGFFFSPFGYLSHYSLKVECSILSSLQGGKVHVSRPKLALSPKSQFFVILPDCLDLNNYC